MSIPDPAASGNGGPQAKSSLASLWAGLTKQQKVAVGSISAVVLSFGLCCCPLGGWFGFSELSAWRQRQAAKAAGEEFAKGIQDTFKKGLVAPADLEQKAQPEEEITPLDPAEFANLDGIKVNLVSGKIGKLPLLNGFDKDIDSEKVYLQITVRVSNLKENFILDFSSWQRNSDFHTHNPSLSDEFKNRYRIYGGELGYRFKGVKHVSRIKPNETTDDLIAFEEPLEKAKEFTLDLPGENIRRPKNRVVYRIPRDWFSKPPAADKQ